MALHNCFFQRIQVPNEIQKKKNLFCFRIGAEPHKKPKSGGSVYFFFCFCYTKKWICIIFFFLREVKLSTNNPTSQIIADLIGNLDGKLKNNENYV